MRAAVEITGTAAEVVYNLAELVDAEEVGLEEDLCSWAWRETADEFLLNHKVVVLTEGRSDIEAIESALHILRHPDRPHVHQAGKKVIVVLYL